MSADEKRIEQLAAEQGPRWPSRKDAWLDGWREGQQHARMTGTAAISRADHLDALGEAEKTNRDMARREMDEREALEAKVAEQRTYIDLLVKAGKGSEDAFEAAQLEAGDLRVELDLITKDRDLLREKLESLRREVKANFDGRTEERDRAEAVEGKLESLRSGLKRVIGQQEILARRSREAAAEEKEIAPALSGKYATRATTFDVSLFALRRLLDASEDTEVTT